MERKKDIYNETKSNFRVAIVSFLFSFFFPRSNPVNLLLQNSPWRLSESKRSVEIVEPTRIQFARSPSQKLSPRIIVFHHLSKGDTQSSGLPLWNSCPFRWKYITNNRRIFFSCVFHSIKKFTCSSSKIIKLRLI